MPFLVMEGRGVIPVPVKLHPLVSLGFPLSNCVNERVHVLSSPPLSESRESGTLGYVMRIQFACPFTISTRPVIIQSAHGIVSNITSLHQRLLGDINVGWGEPSK